MPYSPKSPQIDPSEPLPEHLGHRPVYAVPYQHFDGNYGSGTDTKYISIGLAQWDHDEVSVKTMRFGPDKHDKKRWMRQAEEVPLHRAIDMTLFLAKVVFDSGDGILKIPTETFKRQRSDLKLSREKRTYGDMASYNAFLAKNSDLIRERLRILAKVLDELIEGKKI